MTVAETQPSIKGATIWVLSKPATMETGLVVNVLDFIEAGQNWSSTPTEGTYVSSCTREISELKVIQEELYGTEQFGDIVAPRIRKKLLRLRQQK